MKIDKINKAANILYNSRINLKKIKELPEDCNPKNQNDAYAIQNALTKKYLFANDKTKVIGKKIGCTNKAAQNQLNVNESFFGNIFSNNISKSNCKISPKKYFSPFIEPEFSFLMKEELDIAKAPYSSEIISEYIMEVLPSIELVDSRYEDWTKIGVNNLIADNAVHAHWIFGQSSKNLNIIDFNNHSVDLLINGKLIEKGNSRNVMENPINSLTWLINKLASNGQYLPKNHYVSTGTCTKAIPIFKGDNIKADFGSLGSIDFTFIE
tara:strand:+ start:3157 stop:3957 length:801 start_codon:yes stop_codon:yes gene_type:complete